jgi:hypothetical protein
MEILLLRTTIDKFSELSNPERQLFEVISSEPDDWEEMSKDSDFMELYTKKRKADREFLKYKFEKRNG